MMDKPKRKGKDINGKRIAPQRPRRHTLCSSKPQLLDSRSVGAKHREAVSLQITHVNFAGARVDAHAGRVGEFTVAVAVGAKRAAKLKVTGGGEHRDALVAIGDVQQCALGVDAETLRANGRMREKREDDDETRRTRQTMIDKARRWRRVGERREREREKREKEA